MGKDGKGWVTKGAVPTAYDAGVPVINDPAAFNRGEVDEARKA